MLDHNKNSQESTSNTSTELKKLLIDIYQQDASDTFTYIFQNKNNNLSKDVLFSKVDLRRNRFNEAFSTMFEDVEFYKIEAIDSQQKVLFKKNNETVDIDSLSSGEKQIVYRGAFFLRDKKLMEGAIMIIDEPEISMHPLWQKDILKYHQSIATNEQGIQSQLFVATHSEYVVKSTMNETTKIISLSRNGDEMIATAMDHNHLLPTLTISEIKKSIFGIFNDEYHDSLYAYVEENIFSNGNGYISQNDVDDKFLEYIDNSPQWNDCKTTTINRNTGKEYKTLPVAIRNHFHHPYNGYNFDYDDLKRSTLLLEEIIKKSLDS